MTFRKLQTTLLFSSVLFVGAAAFSIGFFGLNFGIDFTGGSLLEVTYQGERPSLKTIEGQLKDFDLGSLYIQPTREKGMIFRMKDLDEQTHQQMVAALGEGVEELRFESIGPVIGKELREKTLVLAALAIAAVVLYIAFAFRRTAGSLLPWHWSGAALVASLHDILLPLGVFAALGFFQGVQVTIPVVVALLTVIGYSINDTVVVFDRIRENLFLRTGFDFTDTVKQSLRQTWFRSLSTSLTTLTVLFSIYFFGGETLHDFSLMLILGIAAGTYSSLFLAPPLLLLWRKNAPNL